ncbi:MAG: hypothetical protein ACJASB_001178 [Shewanella psychromarinicola]|jgi:hypothetical protein
MSFLFQPLADSSKPNDNNELEQRPKASIDTQ